MLNQIKLRYVFGDYISMINKSSISKNYQVPFISLAPFLFITFGLAWGILGLFIFLPDQMTGFFGELTGQHPLFILGVWAPAIATFVVIIWTSGFKGLRCYFSRLLLWQCSTAWYVFLIIAIPLIFFIGSYLKGNFLEYSFPFTSISTFFMALAMTMIKGPVEEFGWRGFALPLLQRKFAPIWAGLILGIIWGFWHLPAFLLSGTPHKVLGRLLRSFWVLFR